MLVSCKKKLVLTALAAVFLHAGNVFAVGLGDLTVNSSLNEPLDATIQLVGLDGLGEDQIEVGLGSPDDFERANIARVGLIDDIVLEVDVIDRESGLVHLSSDQPVREPFLNMVISMRWPNGRLMRDYTALIDLPVFISDEPTAAPVNVPESSEPAPAPQQPRSQILVDNDPPDNVVPPALSSTPSPESSPTPQTSAATDDDEVVVAAGDNLYNIAVSNRPADNVSVGQTMLAIQRANPDAFIDGDINRIRVGSVLRMPTLQEVQSIDQSQAVNQIALQDQASSAEPLAFNSNTSSTAQSGEDELTILSGDAGDPPTVDDDLVATIAALENQLMISEESLDRARLENQELRARFAELEEQIEILQNIISMQDARLAQLQVDLAANQAAPEPEPEPVTEAPAQPVPVAAQSAPQDNSLMRQISAIFENTLVLLSSLVALIVLVLGFLVWRRRAAQDEMEDYALEGAQATYVDEEPDGASAGFLAALKSRFSKDEAEDAATASNVAASESHDDADEDSEDDDSVDDDDDYDDEDDLDSAEDEADEDDASDDEDDDDDYDDEDSEDNTDSEDEDDLNPAFAMGDLDFDDEDEDEESADAAEEDDDDADTDELTADAEDELDLNFGDDEDEEVSEAIAASDESEDTEFDLGDLGNFDSDDDTEEDTEQELSAAQPSEEEQDDTETFAFNLGNDDASDVDDTPEIDSAETETDDDVESFDFSLDDTPATPAAVAEESTDEDVESFEFSLGDASTAPAAAAETADDEPEEVETFEFDVGSVSSFEEDDNTEAGTAEAGDDTETFVFNMNDNDETDDEADPLAAALDEIDPAADESSDDSSEGGNDDINNDMNNDVAEEIAADSDDELDLDSIEIDDSLFDSDEVAEGARDEASTKLDLAVAYEAMGDMDGAREILQEVMAEGNDSQKAEAEKLMEKWSLS